MGWEAMSDLMDLEKAAWELLTAAEGDVITVREPGALERLEAAKRAVRRSRDRGQRNWTDWPRGYATSPPPNDRGWLASH